MTLAWAWRGSATDDDLVDLVRSHGGTPEPGWWDRIRPELAPFDERACRFAPTPAGLIRLR